MSYTIDVYRKQFKPELDLIQYLCFVSFFPQLVAGPIERASKLLPQLHLPNSITINTIYEAVWLLSWGYFLKICIGDVAGRYVDVLFLNPPPNGVLTFLGGMFFHYKFMEISAVTV